MAGSPIEPIIKHLRTMALRHHGGGFTDGQLLESFVVSQDTAAFEALLRRHGSMVWGVCRRVLRNHQDIEDAFQATFLVLARKAAAVSPRELVGNWLYGVAHTTALRAKVANAKQRVHERQMVDMPEPASADTGPREDLQALLDQELTRLPDKYRSAIVLCDLEGRTRREVAQQLKIPEGTLSSRLTTGRRMFAKRLARHGLPLPAGAVGIQLSQQAALASVPPGVVSSTIKAVTSVAAGQAVATGLISANVVALTDGVMKVMLLTKLKTTMVVLLVVGSLVAFGGGAFYYHGDAAQRDSVVVKSRLNEKPKEVPIPEAKVAEEEEVPKEVSVHSDRTKREETLAIMQKLGKPIETKFLHEKTKLRTALEYISDKHQVTILVDEESFREPQGADELNLYDQDVGLPAINVKMTLNKAFRLILAQVGGGQATFIIRDNVVEVISKRSSTSASLLSQPVFTSFRHHPLQEALQELSDVTGLTINVDVRIGDKIKAPITAIFRGSTLEEAIVVVTESAKLKFVVFPSGVYVTTPEHASVLQKEQDQRNSARMPVVE